VDISAFNRHFPKLYHLTFAANQASIETNGLMSASALADLYAFTAEERKAIVVDRRLCIQELRGIAIRDQLPAQESRMKTCLVNITIPDWLAVLNSKIFFFPSLQKASKFIAAYADYDNIILEVDTAALLATHATEITLSRMNTGAFIFNPKPRGRDSFIPLADYVFKTKRDVPAEITINAPIPNIAEISNIIYARQLVTEKVDSSSPIIAT
jgi:hypothetical protein